MEEPKKIIPSETINKNSITIKTTPITDDFTFGKVLGEGSSGKVLLGYSKATNQKFAIKILKKSKNNFKEILNEVNIISKLNHPNIMKLYNLYNNDSNYYIVTEYCKGVELFDTLSKKDCLKEEDSMKIMFQLLNAIKYSHHKNIIHRDIKPENILINDKSPELKVKIIDWGSAIKIKKTKKLNLINGTAYYIAPEVISGKYNIKCDIWSCGVILYILLCGYPPFNGDCEDEIINNIINEKIFFPKEEWDKVSAEAIDLVKKMLRKDPEKRISANECIRHSWFKKCRRLTEHIKKYPRYLSKSKKIKDKEIKEIQELKVKTTYCSMEKNYLRTCKHFIGIYKSPKKEKEEMDEIINNINTNTESKNKTIKEIKYKNEEKEKNKNKKEDDEKEEDKKEKEEKYVKIKKINHGFCTDIKNSNTKSNNEIKIVPKVLDFGIKKDYEFYSHFSDYAVGKIQKSNKKVFVNLPEMCPFGSLGNSIIISTKDNNKVEEEEKEKEKGKLLTELVEKEVVRAYI